MTANQINYAKHLEDVRTHRTNEEIAARQASAAERQATVSEGSLDIARQNAESNVINAYANQISAGAAAQNAATNVLSQQETVRHNKAQELLDQFKTQKSYEASIYGSNASKYNAELSSRTQLETTEQSNRYGIAKSIFGSLLTVAGAKK